MSTKTTCEKLKPNIIENKDKVKIFPLKLGKVGGIYFQPKHYTPGN